MSLTLAEARRRAAELSDVSYEIDLDLRAPGDGRFGCRTSVGFRAGTDETFLELTAAEDLEVTVDGHGVEPRYDGRRLRLTGLGGLHRVVVTARLPYVTDGEGMHAFHDPVDGRTYVGAYCGMDLAQKVFACFDQNDLKAPITLRVCADPAWTVLANGSTRTADGGRWEFATTPAIPPALFVVAGGEWASVRWEHAGLAFGWHARASLAAELERDAPELCAVTDGCFDHYATMFDEPYPFDSYDQVMVPGLNWGAQEMPGCVTYRDEYLPRGQISEDLSELRASVIAHEMAHMWFGDLVTMTWWEDTWLQESFADYMGYRVAADGAGRVGALLGHEIGRKPAAYDADQRRSTHPIAPRAEDVPDVDSAATIFDAISYSKGSSALRQLVTWLGDEPFLRGLNTYLTRHRFGNAVLDDFVSALDQASERDVRGWVEGWLRSTGFDTVRVRLDGDVPVLTRDGSRSHRIRVTAYDEHWSVVGTVLVDLADEPVRLPDWAGRVVVPNSHGETFARVELAPPAWQAVLDGLGRIEDDLVRSVLWTAAFDQVHTGSMSASTYFHLVRTQLVLEPRPALVTAVLRRTLDRVLPLRVPRDRVADGLDAVAAACRAGLERSRTPGGVLAHAEGLACTGRDENELLRWLEVDSVHGVPLPPTLRWRAVQRLAELGLADPAFVAAEGRRDRTAEGELGAARALAARPTREAKESAWAAAATPDIGNRRFQAVMGGLWSLEQTGLLDPFVDRYFAAAPGWARRGQGFAQVVGQAFPALPLTQAQMAALVSALDGEVPTVLRRQWADRLDDLLMSAHIGGGRLL